MDFLLKKNFKFSRWVFFEGKSQQPPTLHTDRVHDPQLPVALLNWSGPTRLLPNPYKFTTSTLSFHQSLRLSPISNQFPLLLASRFLTMAQAITFNGIAVVFIVAAIFASATVSAQDFAGAPAPAPGMDAGSAHSSGISGAVMLL